MSTKEEMKAKVNEVIDQHAADLIDVARRILAGPEPGFREQKTARLVQEEFNKLELPHRGQSCHYRRQILGGGRLTWAIPSGHWRARLHDSA